MSRNKRQLLKSAHFLVKWVEAQLQWANWRSILPRAESPRWAAGSTTSGPLRPRVILMRPKPFKKTRKKHSPMSPKHPVVKRSRLLEMTSQELLALPGVRLPTESGKDIRRRKWKRL